MRFTKEIFARITSGTLARILVRITVGIFLKILTRVTTDLLVRIYGKGKGLWTRSYESVQDPTGILWNPYQFWK